MVSTRISGFLYAPVSGRRITCGFCTGIAVLLCGGMEDGNEGASWDNFLNHWPIYVTVRGDDANRM